MERQDAQVTQIADSWRVNGYIVGLDKQNVRKSILRAIDPDGGKPQPNFSVAHLRAAESDLVVAIFPPAFARLAPHKQQAALDAVSAATKRENLSGAVAGVYRTEDGGTGTLAPEVFQRFMTKMSLEFAQKLPKKSLYVEWPEGNDPTAEPEVAAAGPLPIDDDDLEPLPLFEEDITDRRRGAARSKRAFARGLTEEDIRAVGLAFKEMGPQEFVDRYVRHQVITLQGQAQPMTPMMREFFVSIEQLRTSFFPGVEMRGSTRAFQSLTHMLDQLMLRSLAHLPKDGLPSSINLNVHSILSKTFDTVLKTTPLDLLTFEIPQPMIGSYPEEFKKARELIFAHGGKIAVDQIFPDTIGALDLDGVGHTIAKLHWKGDLKNISQTHREFVKKNLDRGVTLVMSRVDDPAAFDIAQEFGIRNFQGFLIDEMATPK